MPRPPAAIDLAGAAARGRGVGLLGATLAWAVAFADLGTSVYYVPAILYRGSGAAAAALVLVATLAFVVVAAEHLEVAHRYPRGGGGVAAAVEAFGVRVGVVSGAFMVSAYLIAIALAAVTAMSYLAMLAPPWPHEVEITSVAAIFVVGALSWSGTRAVARIAFVAALAAVSAQAALAFNVIRVEGPGALLAAVGGVQGLPAIDGPTLFTGFAGAWLAYSGLESLGQLSSSMREPRRVVTRRAMLALVATVLVTSPALTALAVWAVSTGRVQNGGALMGALAEAYGGRPLALAVCLSAAALLLVAAKVAFIGCYNVFHVLGEHGYLPAAVARSQQPEAPPRGAVVVITLGAMALAAGTGGEPATLAQLFAFGLLGSYTITSVSLDVLRWREGRRGVMFALGLLATVALAVPWVTSWFTKWRATLYGGLASGALLLVALVTHRGWIRSGRFGFITAASAEKAGAALDTAVEVLTLEEAVEVKASYPSTTLVAMRAPNANLCREAAQRAKGAGDSAVYLVFVDEIPGFIFPPTRGPSEEALRVLRAGVGELRRVGIDAVPVWRLAHDAGASIAEAAEALGMTCVFIGTTQRSAVWHFLQGSVLKRLVKALPEAVHVVICQ
jgi:amino acid transporter